MMCISDPVSVFEFLEKHGEANFNPKLNCSFCFSCDSGYAVFVFCSDGIAKGPRLYLFDHPLNYSRILDELNTELDAVHGDAAFEDAKALAVENLRRFFETQQASHFFFDAH